MNLEHLDALLRHYIEIGPKGCGAVVTHHGKVVYEGYAGYADAERGGPAGPDTVYRIYSCTKVFTAVAAMQLYEKGLFQLNDPIEQYLPEFDSLTVFVCSGNGSNKTVPAQRPITIRDLLSMRSGITGEGAANSTEQEVAALVRRLEEAGSYTERDLVRGLARIPLAFQPGGGFYYGLSHEVIGALIVVLSGKSLGQYFQDEIFAPLGMVRTGFFREGVLADNLAVLYTWTPDGRLEPYARRDYQFEPGHRWESAGSGLLTTVSDMVRFASALSMGGTLDGVRIIGRKTIDLMRTNQLEGGAMADFQAAWANGWEFLAGYGYGLGVRTLMRPELGGVNGSVGEFGWGGMAGTYLMADPAEELAIAYAHQIIPNNMEGYCHPRLKHAVYAALE